MKFLLRLLINTLALFLIAYLFADIYVSSFTVALWGAIILGLVNALIRPGFILITLPINIITLGLFTLIINALLLWFVASLLPGFEIKSFWSAFWGSITLAFISWLTNKFIKSSNI